LTMAPTSHFHHAIPNFYQQLYLSNLHSDLKLFIHIISSNASNDHENESNTECLSVHKAFLALNSEYFQRELKVEAAFVNTGGTDTPPQNNDVHGDALQDSSANSKTKYLWSVPHWAPPQQFTTSISTSCVMSCSLFRNIYCHRCTTMIF